MNIDFTLQATNQTLYGQLSMEQVAQLAGFLGAVAENAKNAPKPAPNPVPPPQPVPAPQEPAPPRWSTHKGRIFRQGKEIQLRGINWFGFETETVQLHGLWTGRTLESFLDQIKGLGFNALRIPLSPEALRGGTSFELAKSGVFPSILDRGRTYWRSGLVTRKTEVEPAQFAGGSQYIGLLNNKSPLDRVWDLVKAAHDRDLYILFDMHNSKAGDGLRGTPIVPALGRDFNAWASDLKALASMAENMDNILGIDLCNEPYDLTWQEWRQLAVAATKAILAVNPEVLVFVEGVGNKGNTGGYSCFWGENMSDAGNNNEGFPADRVVYSPHAYGPSVADADYFHRNFPGDMPAIWGFHFGYLAGIGLPVVPGEWGGSLEYERGANDKVWNETFSNYLKSELRGASFHWCLNPNSGDTKGVLLDDWQTVNQDKMKIIRNSWGQ